MKPSWDDAPKDANWLSMDLDERWFWYQKKPKKNTRDGYWYSTGPLSDSGHAGGVNYSEWSTTLERRPK